MFPAASELVANFGVANFTLLSKGFGTENQVYFEQADLTKPETIPATLVGIHTVIDCATGRPEEPIKTVGIRLKF